MLRVAMVFELTPDKISVGNMGIYANWREGKCEIPAKKILFKFFRELSFLFKVIRVNANKGSP